MHWRVTRDPRSSRALAVAIQAGAPMDELAALAGLEAGEAAHWAAPARGGVQPFCDKGAEIHVPNTIYAVWNGHFGAVGRWLEGYNRRVAHYERLGYKVATDYGPSADAMLDRLSALWDARELLGFYYMGHGNAIWEFPQDVPLGRVTWKDKRRALAAAGLCGEVPASYRGFRKHDCGRALWDYEVVGRAQSVHAHPSSGRPAARMKYRLAILWLSACHSGQGEWEHVAAGPSVRKEYFGAEGVYLPVVHCVWRCRPGRRRLHIS